MPASVPWDVPHKQRTVEETKVDNDSGHILVVDDHRTNRLKMSLAVQSLGHTTVLAEDGRQALDMLCTEPFDLVLLDIVMPVINGYQVLEEMEADPNLRDIPVIVISAAQEMDSVVSRERDL